MDEPTEVKLIQDNEKAECHPKQQISKCRRYFPQVVATMARNLITLNTGLFEGIPTLVIPSVMSKGLNADEIIHITPSQSSWIASCASISHPIGAFAGCLLSDAIGRRKSLLLACFPFIIGWSMLGLSNSLLMIYAAFAIMGMGFGLKEASSMTYIGEISETSIRGVLLASAGIFSSSGYFVVYSMGVFLSWRKIALVCVVVPVCILTAIFFVPETPIWLLSKNQHGKAIKSLQWLRGCVSPETVHDEYDNLQSYSVASKMCSKCSKQQIKCEHTENFSARMKQISRRRVMKPFILITALQFFLQFSAINTWRPYIIQILNAYAIRMDANMTTVLLSALGFVARLCLLPILRALGKRRIYLISTAVTFLCCFGLSAIGFSFFPSGWSSFDMAAGGASINSTYIRESVGNYGHVALVLILIMQFAVNIGISIIPFMMTSELFPFKLRSVLCSITTAIRYIFIAISTKLYYNIETWFALSGAAAFYGFISLSGFIVMYFILPETEGCSLEEIELHFSDNTRRFTDINIKRSAKQVDVT